MGLHVLIGTIFLAVCFFRLMNGHFTKTHHVGFGGCYMVLGTLLTLYGCFYMQLYIGGVL